MFTATAALSLAIGIGANTAIFTVANALLFRPPAGIADPSELVVIGTARGDGGLNPLGYAAYLEIARRTTSLTGVFAEEMFPHVMGLVPSGTATAEPVLGRYVTANFFNALGRASVSRARVRRRRRGGGGPRLRLLDGDGSTATTRWSAGRCGSTGGP